MFSLQKSGSYFVQNKATDTCTEIDHSIPRMGPLHKRPTWDKNTDLAERQTNYKETIRKMKKSDHSKWANILSFQGTTALFALERGVFGTSWLLHAKGPLNSLTPALECSALPTNRGSLQELHCFPSENRGKDWDSNVEFWGKQNWFLKANESY